jgi:hypothetical protein
VSQEPHKPAVVREALRVLGPGGRFAFIDLFDDAAAYPSLQDVLSVIEVSGCDLAVNEALEKFAALDPRKAELVKLRYFVGMSFDEAATTLGIAVPTAKQWWAYARAWLWWSGIPTAPPRRPRDNGESPESPGSGGGTC